MKVFTVTATGQILDYITIYAIDHRGVFLGEYMIQVGMMYVPIPEGSEGTKFTEKELLSVLGPDNKVTPDDPLAPRKLLSVPSKSSNGSILVLIETQVAVPEERELATGRRIQGLIDLCEIRKPFTEDEWISFFKQEWNLASSYDVERNAAIPGWETLIGNRNNLLIAIPTNEGFEIVCGYVEGVRNRPTRYIAYRYDNIGDKLVCQNSLATVAKKLEALWARYYKGEMIRIEREKEFKGLIEVERIRKLEID